MSGWFEEISNDSPSEMSEGTTRRVEDILTASQVEILGKEAEAELNARLKEIARKTEGLAEDIERGTGDRTDDMADEFSELEDTYSYVEVTGPGIREDIEEARLVPGRLKEEMHFCQGDHLDMANAKVKPRPVLEKDIDDREKEFQEVLQNRALAEVHDLAGMASESVSEIKRIGHEDSASVVHATGMIGSIVEAFRAFCICLQVDTRIRQETEEALAQFTDCYKRRLEKLREIDMSAAEQLLEKAFEHLSISRESAAYELSAVDAQVKQVEESSRLVLFDSLKNLVTGNIKEELTDLKSLQEHCTTDIALAEERKDEVLLKHAECTQKFQANITRYDTQLEENRRQQEKLMRELTKLREKEQELKSGKGEEEKMQQTAATAIEDACVEIGQEIDTVKDLKKRAEAAISIMQRTEGLSELIFDSAMQKEHLVQKTLGERRIKALDNYRQVLLESAVAHKVQERDHNVNVQQLKDQIQELSSQRRQKAQTGLKSIVDRLQGEIKELELQIQIERSNREENSKKLAALEKQIEEVDKQYTPEDQLETVQSLYDRRLEQIKEFWDTPSEDSLTFDSIKLGEQ